jgi:hypothetical protein
MSIQILPRLWIATDISTIKNRDFFMTNNIKYVINLTYDIPNYFKNITYFNVPFSNENINESELVMSMEQLFNVINKFIVQGYNYGIGIMIHDKTGKLSMLFAAGFLISRLKISLRDVSAYFAIHNLKNIEYIINNEHLKNLEKRSIKNYC